MVVKRAWTYNIHVIPIIFFPHTSFTSMSKENTSQSIYIVKLSEWAVCFLPNDNNSKKERTKNKQTDWCTDSKEWIAFFYMKSFFSNSSRLQITRIKCRTTSLKCSLSVFRKIAVISLAVLLAKEIIWFQFEICPEN